MLEVLNDLVKEGGFVVLIFLWQFHVSIGRWRYFLFCFFGALDYVRLLLIMYISQFY